MWGSSVKDVKTVRQQGATRMEGAFPAGGVKLVDGEKIKRARGKRPIPNRLPQKTKDFHKEKRSISHGLAVQQTHWHWFVLEVGGPREGGVKGAETNYYVGLRE